MNFQFKGLNGFASIWTLSPNGKFYYKLMHPKEFLSGEFYTKAAFYSIENQLVYYDKSRYFHDLATSELFEIVYWSKTGNIAFFIEFSFHINENIYCFIDLHNERLYRIKDNNLVSEITPNFEDTIFYTLIRSIEGQELIKDSTQINFVINLLGIKKWYP